MSPVWRVLAVDDHPINLRLLELMLQQCGHEVHTRTDGQQAVDAVREQAFDLVLMDLHMPVMDGAAAIVAIRALPAPRSQVPIFAVTADTAQATEQRVIDAGANGFLHKPLTLQMLRDTLATVATQQMAMPPAAADHAPDAAPATDAAPPCSRYGAAVGGAGHDAGRCPAGAAF